MSKLYLMLGYPGAGKTTVSKLIHERTGAVHIWADHERHTRFEKPTHSHAENLSLYAQLNSEAEALLKAGKDVIFDTNFNFYKDREHLRQIAAAAGAETVLVWVQTPRDLARKRAVEDSDGQETRVWGNMATADFDRISGNMEQPHDNEPYVAIDGTDLTEKSIEAFFAQLA